MAAEITLEALGFTKEDIADRVVNRAVETLLSEAGFDEGGDEERRSSSFDQQMQARIRELLDEKVRGIGESLVDPLITKHADGILLQQTNQWGEKKGEVLTITEYMLKRAEDYISEPVDFQGNRLERGGYGKASQTRITHLIEKYIHYHIDSAVKAALQDFNSKLSIGIAETVKIKLAEALAGLKVGVQTK